MIVFLKSQALTRSEVIATAKSKGFTRIRAAGGDPQPIEGWNPGLGDAARFGFYGENGIAEIYPDDQIHAGEKRKGAWTLERAPVRTASQYGTSANANAAKKMVIPAVLNDV